MTGDDSNPQSGKLLRVLTLDGGGAKGFYTLGVLKEIEAMSGCRLHEKFDLVFGTSTGAIIATLITLGHSVDEIIDLYRANVPKVMSETSRPGRTEALRKLAEEVFGDAKFDEVKTGIGVVAANWLTERPMIFKAHIGQAHGRKATFMPGFGVKIADAVQASCSAYPFFERTVVETAAGEHIELIDGGYCANNPTLYAIADAVRALKVAHQNIRLVSIGVGVYPEPRPGWKSWISWEGWKMRIGKRLVSVQLLQKTLEINTQSMDQLREVLFADVPTIRISDTYSEPEMATDLLEHDLTKLSTLFQRGRNSFGAREQKLREFLL